MLPLKTTVDVTSGSIRLEKKQNKEASTGSSTSSVVRGERKGRVHLQRDEDITFMALPQGKSTLFNPGSGTWEAAAYAHLSCCRTISFINQKNSELLSCFYWKFIS